MKKLLKSLFSKNTCTATFNISKPKNIIASDPDKDGIALFDLTINNDAVLEGLDITEYTVNYFESEKLAIANKNAFETPWKYYNILPEKETIYVRVTSKNNPAEYVIESFTIIADPITETKNTYDFVF